MKKKTIRYTNSVAHFDEVGEYFDKSDIFMLFNVSHAQKI